MNKPEQNTNAVVLQLKSLVANTAQSRGMGALPTLQAMGYGLFEKLEEHEDKEPIWSMLMSPKAEIRKEAAELIAQNEGHILDKAESLEAGQLQNIVVVEVKGKPGCYDVVAGMLRCISLAYLHAVDPKAPATVEAKIMPYKKPVDLLFMSLDENNNRKDESPIDKALTYKRLKEEHGVKPDDIGKRQGKSGQSIRDHLKLLDPALDDKRMAIHNGTMTIDKALKLLRSRKNTGGDDTESTKETGKRARMHSVKKLAAAYGAKKKPDWMEQKEWEMVIKEDVRKWLAWALKLKYKPFTGEVLSEEPEEPEAAKPKVKPFGLIIPRSMADKLLSALGKDSTDWTDEVVKEKLEGIVNLVEDGQTLEDEKLNGILEKLTKNYARGLNITIKASATKAAAA